MRRTPTKRSNEPAPTSLRHSSPRQPAQHIRPRRRPAHSTRRHSMATDAANFNAPTPSLDGVRRCAGPTPAVAPDCGPYCGPCRGLVCSDIRCLVFHRSSRRSCQTSRDWTRGWCLCLPPKPRAAAVSPHFDSDSPRTRRRRRPPSDLPRDRPRLLTYRPGTYENAARRVGRAAWCSIGFRRLRRVTARRRRREGCRGSPAPGTGGPGWWSRRCRCAGRCGPAGS